MACSGNACSTFFLVITGLATEYSEKNNPTKGVLLLKLINQRVAQIYNANAMHYEDLIQDSPHYYLSSFQYLYIMVERCMLLQL